MEEEESFLRRRAIGGGGGGGGGREGEEEEKGGGGGGRGEGWLHTIILNLTEGRKGGGEEEGRRGGGEEIVVVGEGGIGGGGIGGGGGGGGGGGDYPYLESPLYNITNCLSTPWISDCITTNTTTSITTMDQPNFTPGINVTNFNQELPPSLQFDNNALIDIIVYSVMFAIAATGNLTVFITLCRNRHRKSRVNLMIMHLAAADLLVTLINFPLEVGWRVTTQWLAGNLACKMFQFMRAFGLYLSSLVLVCISLDRYFAIVHPLKVNDAQRRGKMMVCLAWSVAAVCSLPQSVIFHVDSHPQFPQFKQCVTFGFFRTHTEEAAYNLFGLAAMYFLPLTIIIIVYFRILWEISQKSKDSEEPKKRKGRGGSIGGVGRGGGLGSKKTGGGENHPGGGGGRLRLRRSDMSNIERARARTLRMTVIIVLAFVWCWTPYVIIMMWYTFDRASAEQVDKRLQDSLFIMAVSNSCVNPIVYGTYTINLRGELDKCFGRRRGGGGRGISGVNSSLHHVTTRRSTTGHSIVVRSTVASQGGVSTCHKTSLTQLSGRKPSIQGASNPPRAPPKPFPLQDVGSSCVMIEMEPQVSLNPPPDPMKGDPWPGKESKDTNMKDPSLNPPSDPMKGDSWPGKESKEPNIKDPSLNPLGGDSWAQSESRDANKKDYPQDLVPMTSLVPGSEVNAGSEAAWRENGVAGGGDGGGGGGVVVLTAC